MGSWIQWFLDEYSLPYDTVRNQDITINLGTFPDPFIDDRVYVLRINNDSGFRVGYKTPIRINTTLSYPSAISIIKAYKNISLALEQRLKPYVAMEKKRNKSFLEIVGWL